MILFSRGEIIAQGPELHQDIVVKAGEELFLTLVALCDAQSRENAVFNIDIQGAGADVRLNGIYVCGGDSRTGIRVNLTHSSGGSKSTQMFRGIVSGNARSVFDGKITVAPDAQKTEAYQTNRNLLLSDNASVEASPQLEIYADDVKCSHGATSGSLNEDEQFYMRSRGISLEQARRLQMISFLSPAMEGLDDAVRERILGSLRG